MKRDPTIHDASQANALRAHAKDQAKQFTQAAIGLANALFEVHWGTTKDGTPLVVAWGHEDFDEYAEHELLMHGGTARSYVRVYDELCVRHKFTEGELPESITALRELSKVTRKLKDAREIKPWLKKALEMPACEFHDEVERLLYGRNAKFKAIGFSMPFATAGKCMKRIREAQEAMQLSTRGEALARIIEEWKLGKPTAGELRRLRSA